MEREGEGEADLGWVAVGEKLEDEVIGEGEGEAVEGGEISKEEEGRAVGKIEEEPVEETKGKIVS